MNRGRWKAHRVDASQPWSNAGKSANSAPPLQLHKIIPTTLSAHPYDQRFDLVDYKLIVLHCPPQQSETPHDMYDVGQLAPIPT